MSIPLAPPGKTVEAIRTVARRRFLGASASFAAGTLVLSASQAFVLVNLPDVLVLTTLILGALLQVLGLISAAYAAVAFRRITPLSEAAGTAQRLLVAALTIVLPLAVVAAAAWVVLALGEAYFALLPELPFFWGPVCIAAAAGLVFAARELASERMVVLAGLGCGVVVAMAVSASGWSAAIGAASLQSARLAVDLLLAAVGFAAIALAFDRDPWVTRQPRPAMR